PNAEIVALRHRGCPGGTEQGIDRCVATIEEALRLKPQAAVIANPATHHLTAAGVLADAGVHLLVEKPIASSTAGVAELISRARARNSVLMTGYNLRYLPSLRSFRDLVIGGRVGRALSVRSEIGQFLPSWRPESDYRQTVSAQAALGGGALLELSHDIDYLRWIFGAVDLVSAILSRQGTLEIDVEDSAHLVLRFASVDNQMPLLATLNMDFLRHDTTRGCTVIGETGSLRWNAITGVVDVFEAGSTGWTVLFAHRASRDESYLGEWHDFISCIADGTEPTVTGADGLAVLGVIEAARRSSSCGAVERVDRSGNADRPENMAGW
ncbi:MAG: Gfo/Idh/MocA family oxidoreductase, partial [Chloroflexota bacterium]